jgi:hypothetical protein
MSRFTEASFTLTGDLKNGRPVAVLTSDLVYEVGHLGSGWIVKAKAGFRTDLASLPLWLLRTGEGKQLSRQLARAAIVHDVMRAERKWPKFLGDYVFWEAMAVDSVPLGWRWICGLSVLLNFSRY